ncbi:hypothetical protein [Rugamonas rivuli]|uniref:Uncharacterized protein n=1 Tax=Rugamonas rivuli TaxID=2743358 RepID=A0A843SFQ6_9BURK|nr:hypothetical protein [Rugamonas rivuli]MQA22012.1 hypothetical protein [Rugamonas rivuli]
MIQSKATLQTGQKFSRILLLMTAAVFFCAAFSASQTFMHQRVGILAMATLFAHIGSNTTALRTPALGFQWKHMSTTPRALLLAAGMLLTLSTTMSFFDL